MTPRTPAAPGRNLRLRQLARGADRVAIAAATVVVLGSFLPWGRSGAADRNSYELVAAAVQLDLVDGSAATFAPMWYLVPALVGAAWLLAAMNRPAIGASLAAAVGLLSVVLAVQTARSPLVEQAGATLSGGAGAFAIIAALAGRLSRRCSTRGTRRPAARRAPSRA